MTYIIRETNTFMRIFARKSNTQVNVENESVGKTQNKSMQCATDPPPPSKVDDCWFENHFGSGTTLIRGDGVGTC